MTNNQEILHKNLLTSPEVVAGGIDVTALPGGDNFGTAANLALTDGQARSIAFIHQDLYLPAKWVEKISQAIDALEHANEPWGVLGVWGIAADDTFNGRAWCTGGNTEHIGQNGRLMPNESVSIDEIVIILNPKAGLRFDEKLPGFHLYATDICLQAAERGYKTYVVDAPVVHNSKTSPVLDPTYYESYRYMQNKWRHRLPLKTCVLPVTRFGLPVYRRKWRDWKRKTFNPRVIRPRHEDPSVIARQLGYE